MHPEPAPDDLRLHVIDELSSTVQQHGSRLLVVGATARDILIWRAAGTLPQRRTDDVDIAVGVESWTAFQELTADWTPVVRKPHRFRVLDVDVDVIPFGPLESADRSITWSNAQRMTVVGFSEAMAVAEDLQLPSGRSVAVASLPSQVVLKLFAWRDRRAESTKDAIDLRSIILSYSEGSHFDQLYNEHFHRVSRQGYDAQRAGADRIGAEAAATLHHQTLLDTLAMVDEQRGDNGTLAAEMGGVIATNRMLLDAGHRHARPFLTSRNSDGRQDVHDPRRTDTRLPHRTAEM